MIEALDGLPPAKIHCSVLAEEAVKAALKDYHENHENDLPKNKQHCQITLSCLCPRWFILWIDYQKKGNLHESQICSSRYGG